MMSMSPGQCILNMEIDKVDILQFQHQHSKKQDMKFSNDFTSNKLLVLN